MSITVELYRTHTQIVDQIHGRRRLKKSQTRRRTLVDGTFRSRRQNRVSRDATEMTAQTCFHVGRAHGSSFVK